MSDVFNEDVAVERCFRSRKMLRQMIRCFLKDADALLPQMRAALQVGDFTEVGRLGHRLKGTVVYLGAERATAAALAVEHFEHCPGEPAEAEVAIRLCEQECQTLRTALAELRSEDWTT
jgi:HPt (histidine-containing phosphotransfer) domain-containing protein